MNYTICNVLCAIADIVIMAYISHTITTLDFSTNLLLCCTIIVAVAAIDYIAHVTCQVIVRIAVSTGVVQTQMKHV